MDWNQILITVLTSIVPAGIVYFTNRYQFNGRLKELESKNKNEIEKLKLEYDLRMKQQENEMKNQFASKVMTGEIDMSKLGNTLSQLVDLQDKANKLNKNNKVGFNRH